MLKTSRTATTSAIGDGLMKACAQSVMVDILSLFPSLQSSCRKASGRSVAKV